MGDKGRGACYIPISAREQGRVAKHAAREVICDLPRTRSRMFPLSLSHTRRQGPQGPQGECIKERRKGIEGGKLRVL